VLVIGAGMARTGTTSLKRALELLGLGPCYHMDDVMASPRRIREWRAIGRGAAPDWDRVFAGYRSVVDWPAAAFWRELTSTYPEAKLVLTTRDPLTWYDSVRRTVFQQVIDPPGGARTAVYRLLTTVSPNMRAFVQMMDACVYQRLFDGRMADRQHALAVFQRYAEEVQDAFPPQRLLTFPLGDGWENLCEFLGRPVPGSPFPHENSAEQWNRAIGSQIGRLVLLPAAGRPGHPRRR